MFSGYTMGLINERDARKISRWTYDPPYSLYSMEEDTELIEELLDGTYFSVINQDEELVGYFCYGKNAQVPGGQLQGLYTGENVLDIGLGLRPDLTGRGLGLHFLNTGLDFARHRFTPSAFRLSVASFNHRAISLYEKAGFKPVQTFMSKVRNDEVQFLLMATVYDE